jgi:hypothetical protein
MCKVYNTVGALTEVKRHLRQNGIQFDSLSKLISFKKDFADYRATIVTKSRALVLDEKNNLNSAIQHLKNEIQQARLNQQQALQCEIESQTKSQTNPEARPIARQTKLNEVLRKVVNSVKVTSLKLRSEIALFFRLRKLNSHLTIKHLRHNYILSHFEKAVLENCKQDLIDLDRKKRVIDEITPSIYGAMGEEKVAKELERLSDDYILINNLSLSFDRAIYHRQTREYIKSAQIDHLLISPSGLFLIETKNWSKQSWVDSSLRSPIQQVKRSSFALFLKLSNYSFRNNIPIRNVLATTNHVPDGNFQYVKVLPAERLVGYIEYFRPSLSRDQRENLVNYFLEISN